METLKIKAFFAVERLGSFTKAAEEFSYTPSAFCHIADALEQDLGLKLFDRTPKGVSITPSGMALVPYFQALLDAENKLNAVANALSETQTLKIGTYSSIAGEILPAVLEKFKRKHPHILTEILIADDLKNTLSTGLADIVFTDTMPPGNIHFEPLIQDEFVAVVPSSFFPRKRRINKEELYSYPLIRTKERLLDDYLDYTKFREILSLHSVENFSTLSLIKEKLGVAVMPYLAAKDCPNGVKILRLNQTVSRTLGYAYEKDNCSPALQKFISHLNQIKETLFK